MIRVRRGAVPLLTALLCLSLSATVRAETPPGPIFAPDAARISLDEIGLYSVGLALRGKTPIAFPDGWSGDFDERYGIACEPVGSQNGKAAFLLHPPWRNGTGITYQTFRIAVPAGSSPRLTGATALRADAVGKSDGVTFRIYVNGEKRLDVNRRDADWQPFSIDLSGYAGKTVTLRFETDPGPQDNSSFDFGIWGDRTLSFAGWTPPASTRAERPAPLPLNLRRLASAQNGSVVPLSGFSGTVICRQDKATGETILRYHGADGTLEYRWTAPATDADPFTGRIRLHAAMTGDKSVDVPLAGQARIGWSAPPEQVRLLSAKWETLTPSAATLVETYRVGAETATVTLIGRLIGKSLVLDVACDRPQIVRIDGGGWGPVARRRSVALPYYSSPIVYFPRENLFTNAFPDWTISHASSITNGMRADYGARTDGTRALMRERLIYTAAWHLDEALPNIPNTPSPYRSDLADRVVLDIWGGSFDSVRQRLMEIAGWGIDRGVALVHDWQRDGYDNGLPAHVPANAKLGGDDAMKALVKAGMAAGFRMALHENYVDYYPDYEGFSEKDIARKSDGGRVNAWYNRGTKLQSFAVKPTRILPLAQQQSPETVKRYGSDACYLDVHSAVPPWFHVDFDAATAGAGTFHPVWDTHRALWSYERALHHGPVFGEGNDHWYWSGALDGVEAQFGQGWGSAQGTSAPLLVDFDLLKIHPLQFNHGMGYYERWWSESERSSRSLLDLLDQYRMQEAAYGHAAFLGAPTWSNAPLVWLETHLLTPVTARYATAKPVDISYEDGGVWRDATAAAKMGSAFNRVRIRYDDGLTVWANGSDSPLTVSEHILPRWGWLANGDGVQLTGTTLRQGIVSDYAETADSVFANARSGDDWQEQSGVRITPTVAKFESVGQRAFRASYSWAVGQTLKEDERCFVHFVRAGAGAEGIVFQQDHALSTPTTEWKPGDTVTDGPYDIEVPASVAPGDYIWTIGLFSPSGSGRLTLQGRQEGAGRTVLGTLHVTEHGITFTPEPPVSRPRDPVNAAGKVLDFGTLRTNGSVWIHRGGGDWVLQPLPRDRDFDLELSATRFPMPVAVRAVRSDGSSTMVTPMRSGGWWRLPLAAGAREYRWKG